MYLQSLELIGFKSFANKTTLDFHRGVTAIVGPNGCGKSNLLDAIRWVLGEQSAKALRGGEMADVIFSGTDSKQGVGMAEVSLTFAECEKELGTEFNEVRITRRVFRDGRSEYLLNKIPCRLKDIQMLFMDTGIGRSAYSIMEQGKIDQILSSRPEDRRAIFEEAAGITKYKAQKREALRKLEYTDANLVRLTDIIKEVKRQIGSLQRQAGKARRYKALFDDLRTLDTHLSRQQFDELGTGLATAQQEINQLRSKQHSLEEQVESQEFGLIEQRQELEGLEEQILAAHQRVHQLRSQIDGARGRLEFNGERIAEATGLSQRYESDIATANEKLAVQQDQLQETDHQLQEVFESLRAEEQQLQDQVVQVGTLRSQRGESERSAQEYQRRIQHLESRLANIRGELAGTLNQRETSETRLHLLQKELDQTESGRSDLSAQVVEHRSELEAAQNNVQRCRDELKDAEHEVTSRQKQLQQTERDLTMQQRSLAERVSKLEVLRQLNEEGAGLGAGTQAVLKGLDNPQLYRSAVVGALANFLEVSAEFIVAIEAALGQHLQTILIADPAVARAIAATLSETKQGRAALLPIDLLRPAKAIQLEALPEGAVSWALDRVNVRHKGVSGLATRLLERVVIAENLEFALAIKCRAPDLAVATLRGEYISHEGEILAGNADENVSSVLQRKLQIGHLENECAESRAALAGLESQRQAAIQQLEAEQVKVVEHREALQRAQLAASSLQGQLSLLDRELHDVEGKAKTLAWERDSVEQRLNTATAKAQSLESTLGAAGSELADLQQKLASTFAQLDALRTQEDALSDILNELKVKVATERQRQENLQRQRQPMAVRLAELQDLISTRQRDVKTYSARIDQLRQENAALEEQIAMNETAYRGAENEASRLAEERAARLQAMEAVEGSLRALRKQLSECQESRGREEVRATQLELKKESVREHAAQRYHTDLISFEPDWYAFQVAVREQRKRLAADAPQNPSTKIAGEIDWEFVHNAVAEMIERLDAMGPVNLEAIQEYEELEERQRFLDEQYNDLVKSKAELLDAINKINHTTKQLFADTFEQVRRNFQEMFTELFGGGKANLLLVDDSDPLESGVEIIAKPPGKQLQSISLLSGGEKTMTAVALLFAIYMVKPSPFCVLDEMDAPLDESNINRFTRILDRFVTQSQFVVITHNKRTIAKADVLYGVTMEEHGISKLVGVKLTTRAQAHETVDLIGTRNPMPSIAESFGK
jgi:chromosome segregation protein